MPNGQTALALTEGYYEDLIRPDGETDDEEEDKEDDSLQPIKELLIENFGKLTFDLSYLLLS